MAQALSWAPWLFVPCLFLRLCRLSSLPRPSLYPHQLTPHSWLTETLKPAKSRRSCPALCSPMFCDLPSASVHRILQARMLEWVAVPSSRGSFRPRDRTCISYVSAGRSFTTSVAWEAKENLMVPARAFLHFCFLICCWILEICPPIWPGSATWTL